MNFAEKNIPQEHDDSGENRNSYKYSRGCITSLLLFLCTGCALPPPEPWKPRIVKVHKTNPSPALVNPVIYRIDGHRYFILQSATERECADGTIFYIDKKLGIKSSVGGWRQSSAGGRKFTIDAANELYLAAPVHVGSGSGSGGSSGGDYANYSIDAGKTWQMQKYSPRNNVVVTGNIYYSYGTDDYRLDRDEGEFFDMSAPEKYGPEFWIKYHKGSGSVWTEADYPALEDTKYADSDGGNRMKKELAVRRTTNPPKIPSAPYTKIQPIDSGFHCVAQPIVGNEQ